MKKLVSLCSIIIIFSFCSCNRSSQKIIGIKIYDYNKDYNQLVRKWTETGINTAFISKELAENTTFRNTLRDNDIGVYLIFPVFYNPDGLRNDNSLFAITDKGTIAKDEWVEFVCPSRINYRKNRIKESAELVRDLEPDGLSIDFIRNFVYWEKIYPGRTSESIDKACFCDSCIYEFSMKNAIYIPDTLAITTLKATYILKNFEDQWISYQCDLVSSMVEEISKQARSIDKDIKINVHAVPWRDNDFGGANLEVASQDLNKIAPHADYISPMCYSQMLKRDAGWIASVISEMNSKAIGKILPSIQVYDEYIDDPFSAEDFGKCIDAALKAPSEGVVFFSWPLFEKDPARLDILSGKL